MNKKTILLLSTILFAFLGSIIYFRQVNSGTIDIIKTREDKILGYAIYTKDGDILYLDEIESIKNTLYNNVIVKTDNMKIKNPIGLIENPPDKSINDIKKMVLKSLDNKNKILIIYIDGLGYDLYEKAINLGKIPYIASLNKGVKALTVYPPITDVAFASMVTGETPKYTGIHSREKKPMGVDTIFDEAAKRGVKSKVIEGNIKILTCDVKTVLNIDENKDGFIDDEIYKCALKEIQNPPHILLVHFHSYDDMGHSYGPNSEKALNQLNVLDGYIKDIVANYKGDIIITSDHGMHNDGDGGSHGIFCVEDLFIPIIEKQVQYE